MSKVKKKAAVLAEFENFLLDAKFFLYHQPRTVRIAAQILAVQLMLDTLTKFRTLDKDTEGWRAIAKTIEEWNIGLWMQNYWLLRKQKNCWT